MQDFTASESLRRHSQGCSPVDSVPNSWHAGSRSTDSWRILDSGLLRAGDSEFLHAKLERGALDPKSRSRSIGTDEDPVGLLQNRQDVLFFNLLKGRGSVQVTVCVGSPCFQIGQGYFQRGASGENDRPLDYVL